MQFLHVESIAQKTIPILLPRSDSNGQQSRARGVNGESRSCCCRSGDHCQLHECEVCAPERVLRVCLEREQSSRVIIARTRVHVMCTHCLINSKIRVCSHARRKALYCDRLNALICITVCLLCSYWYDRETGDISWTMPEDLTPRSIPAGHALHSRQATASRSVPPTDSSPTEPSSPVNPAAFTGSAKQLQTMSCPGDKLTRIDKKSTCESTGTHQVRQCITHLLITHSSSECTHERAH